MSTFIKINSDELIPTINIKRIRAMTDGDRDSLSRLGDHVNPDKFYTRLDYADGGKSHAVESIDNIAAQGTDLVEISDGVFVLAQNIVKASDLTDKDRQGFEAKTGRALSADYKSRIETKAGTVLAKIKAETIMHRLGQPYRPQTTRTLEPEFSHS